MSDRVQQFYDDNVEYEWGRLGRHRMEFAVSMRILQEYLFGSNLTLVDVGGGPGRYSLELARLGHQVTLVDLSANNLEFARRKAEEIEVTLAQVVQANALELSVLPEQAYDAALLFGPLYHLHKEAERRQAVTQTLARIKPGGLLFATFITRAAGFRDAAANYPSEALKAKALFEQIWETGKNDGDEFPNSYFERPEAVTPFMESCGLTTLELVGVEGVVSQVEDKVNMLDDDEWAQWVEWNYRIGKEPSAHGASDHLCYVGRKGK